MKGKSQQRRPSRSGAERTAEPHGGDVPNPEGVGESRFTRSRARSWTAENNVSAPDCLLLSTADGQRDSQATGGSDHSGVRPGEDAVAEPLQVHRLEQKAPRFDRQRRLPARRKEASPLLIHLWSPIDWR